jgi:type VI secretion system protein ImpK
MEEAAASTAVWQSFLTLLERQALYARRSGGDFASKVYQQAQYIMAALSDEIFLNLDWGGGESWRENLLEARLFQSHRAGEEIFRRLDILLLQRDPVYLDLARIYLFTLALGFQGKFRDQEGGAEDRTAYRRRLFNFLTKRDPDFKDGAGHLFPEAYASTLDQGELKKVPYLRRWLIGIAAALFAWVVISIPIWHELVLELRPAIQDILNK